MTPESDVVEPKRVSIVIVSFNRIDSLRQSLDSLGEDYQILVVDNGSTDGSHALDEDFPNIRFIRLPKNFGLTKALNVGIRAAEGSYVLLLHDDTVMAGESVAKLADYLEEHSDAGAVSPLLLDSEGVPAPQIRDLPSPSEPNPAFRPAEGGSEVVAPAVSGAAIMFRTSFLRALGQIDEHYGTYGSIIELCMQVRRSNRRIVVVSGVTATHELLTSPMNRSILDGDGVAGTAVFLGKHHGLLAGILYRAKSALAGLFTFRIKVLAGALAGAKIDGSS